MKAIANIGRGLVELRELLPPHPGPDQLRVQVAACAVCATDLDAMARATMRRPGAILPPVPDSTWTGTVDAVGSGVSEDWLGQRVAGGSPWSQAPDLLGGNTSGCAQVVVCDPAELRRLPADLDFATATLVTPLATSLSALSGLGPSSSSRALILGDGVTALLSGLAWTISRDVEATVIGARAGHLAVARDFGATQTADYRELGMPFGEAIRSRFGTFTTIIETSGAPVAIGAAFDVAAPGARLVMLGDYRDVRAQFRWNDLRRQRLTLVGVGGGAGHWAQAVEIARQQKSRLAQLVTHRFPAVQFAEAMALIRAERDDVVHVVLQW